MMFPMDLDPATILVAACASLLRAVGASRGNVNLHLSAGSRAVTVAMDESRAPLTPPKVHIGHERVSG